MKQNTVSSKSKQPEKAALPHCAILDSHPELVPFSSDFDLRMRLYESRLLQLTGGKQSLCDFANAHEYFGFHHLENGWVYREWAPRADALFLAGDFNNWNWTDTPLKRIDNGNWELTLPDDVLHHGSRVITIVRNGDRLTQHLPLYTRYAVQDTTTWSWCCEVLDDKIRFPWTDGDFRCDEKPLIYEAHVGMASEEYRVASYREFADNVLPHILDAGYNTIQLMGIMEHPYYGSFGYQVSNFYAPSHRYGPPEDLKYLINRAHEMGIRVLLDVVHSHAVGNTLEGINLFDGTTEQFFHVGSRGDHPAWGTKCFDYAKPEVLHFLLSNLKFWMTEYHFDGFRFDGVTSMLYHDHGLGVNFSSLSHYFTMNTDTESVTYLQLANTLVREVKPSAMTIAEDMSGMPGMCDPVKDGGIGFDYRLAMGLPDMWIKLIKTQKDEDWDVQKIWTELVFRNAPTIAYAESHDQALVGDQTIIFRLAGASMYSDMEKPCHSMVIDRAMALHKLIRLLTLSAGGTGYLNFMGNEFGHPEWIDFPTANNGYSYHYCRRQWSLMNNGLLKYGQLYAFDRDMIKLMKEYHVLDQTWPTLNAVKTADQVLAFERGGLLFVFNLSPYRAYESYPIPVTQDTDYTVIFSSDDSVYDGYDRVQHSTHSSFNPEGEGSAVKLYLPPRVCMVLKPEPKPEAPKKASKPAAKKAAKATEAKAAAAKPEAKKRGRKKAE